VTINISLISLLDIFRKSIYLKKKYPFLKAKILEVEEVTLRQ
jgi:hypothetical protein